MWPSLRHGAIAIAVVGCLAAAAQTGLGLRGAGDGRGVLAMDEEITGSLGPARLRRAGRTLPLSEEERGRIYDGVMRIADAPVADLPAPELADALPRGVPLSDLPAGVTHVVPLLRGYKFVKLDDRILVVDPSSRLVVALIPRYRLLQ